VSVRSFNWRTTSLQRIAQHIHELAAEAGRAVNVYVHGDSIVVRDGFDAGHADDYIGCFDQRSLENHIIDQLVRAANEEVG
jgi:hypothetical protein